MAIKDKDLRLINNEAVFRNWNENVYGRDEIRQKTGSAKFICECSDENCAEVIIMDNQEYGKIHEQRDHFTVVPGHQVGEVEHIVSKRPNYIVVQKKITPPEDATLLHPTNVNNV